MANAFAEMRARMPKYELGCPTRSRHTRGGASAQKGERARPMASSLARRRTRSPDVELTPPIVCIGRSDGELARPTLSELIRWRTRSPDVELTPPIVCIDRSDGELARPTLSELIRWRTRSPDAVVAPRRV